ncbi:MAG: hypothetical protein KGH66_01075 [Candidatus Micrarchaeota archaeon]|nr:hypothetical protein [Candidatus Micrarchaeota archaeon]
MTQQISETGGARLVSDHKERLRGKYKVYLEMLHTSMEGADINMLRKSIHRSEYTLRKGANRLAASGLLRIDGATHTTTEFGKEWAAETRKAIAILGLKYSTAEIPSVIDGIKIKAPSRSSSVYDYSPIADRRDQEEERNMVHRSRLHMVRAILGAMTSKDMIESDIRRAAHFEFNAIGRLELQEYVSLLLKTGMIKRYRGSEAFHITNTGVGFKKALDRITEVIES